MKKIIALCILVLMSSCSRFLEEENLSNGDSDQYYRTAEGFNSLVNANYAQLKEIYGNDAYVFEAGTDLCAVGSGRGVEPEGLSKYTQLNPASDGGITEMYFNCYEAIQRANMALYYSDKTAQTSNLPQLVGEIKYLRANAYFVLTQSFGDLGIITDYNPLPTLSFDRSSAKDVYALIISDLESALNSVSTAAYNGRVNKRAVQHLLAKVYLTRGYETFGTPNDFQTAATYAEAAINGQALPANFADLWKPGNEMNAETIFSVQYSKGSLSTSPLTLGNKQANWYGPYLGGAELGGKVPWRSFTLLPTAFHLGLYSKDDKRYQATFMYEAYTVYYDYFNVANPPAANVKHFYVPQWMTDAELTAYKASHPNATIHNWGTYAAGVVSTDYQTIPVKKFDDPTAPYTINGRVSSRDIILSRLAETYLIAAEAYLKFNPALGLAKINAVRTRAGIPALASYDIDMLLDERGRELFGEYHRWFDLKRTGKLVERASAYNYLIKAANFNGANGVQKILRPIPQTAMDLNQNKNFPQNKAYQ